MTLNKSPLNNIIQLSLVKYPEIKEFLKESTRFKWKYRSGVFAIINNETNLIYIGSSRNLGETIFFHVKKKTKNNRYIAIKQTKVFSLYIMEVIHLSAGDSFMKKRERYYLRQIPKKQRIQLTDDNFLWTYFN